MNGDRIICAGHFVMGLLQVISGLLHSKKKQKAVFDLGQALSAVLDLGCGKPRGLVLPEYSGNWAYLAIRIHAAYGFALYFGAGELSENALVPGLEISAV